MSDDTTIGRFAPNDIKAARAYFEEHGYVVLSRAVPVARLEAFWAGVERLIASDKLTYSVHGQIYTGADVPMEGRRLPRIIDIESHLPEARELMLCEPIDRFLRAWYGAAPTCLQTLTYKYSSEQGAHSDKSLVGPPAAWDYDRETLAASWIAVEASDERNGALIVYPGSHKEAKRPLQDFADYQAYNDYVHAWLEERNIRPVVFRAEAGDILFWHADFFHAGGPITDPSDPAPTRRSLVCHYARLAPDTPSRVPEWRRAPAGPRRLFGERASYFQKVSAE